MMTDQIDIKLSENNCFKRLNIKTVVLFLTDMATVFLTKKLNLLKPEWFMAILLDIIIM